MLSSDCLYSAPSDVKHFVCATRLLFVLPSMRISLCLLCLLQPITACKLGVSPNTRKPRCNDTRKNSAMSTTISLTSHTKFLRSGVSYRKDANIIVLKIVPAYMTSSHSNIPRSKASRS